MGSPKKTAAEKALAAKNRQIKKDAAEEAKRVAAKKRQNIKDAAYEGRVKIRARSPVYRRQYCEARGEDDCQEDNDISACTSGKRRDGTFACRYSPTNKANTLGYSRKQFREENRRLPPGAWDYERDVQYKLPLTPEERKNAMREQQARSNDFRVTNNDRIQFYERGLENMARIQQDVVEGNRMERNLEMKNIRAECRTRNPPEVYNSTAKKCQPKSPRKAKKMSPEQKEKKVARDLKKAEKDKVAADKRAEKAEVAAAKAANKVMSVKQLQTIERRKECAAKDPPMIWEHKTNKCVSPEHVRARRLEKKNNTVSPAKKKKKSAAKEPTQAQLEAAAMLDADYQAKHFPGMQFKKLY